jgi:DNA-directed RNA polymerase subunit F
MLSVKECRVILENYNYHLKDDEIVQLRDFLSRLARAQLNNELKTTIK